MEEIKEFLSGFMQEMLDFKQEMVAFKDDMLDFKQEMLDFKDDMLEFKQEMLDFKKETKEEIQNMNNRIDGLDQKLNARIDGLEQNMNDKIEELRQEMNDKMEQNTKLILDKQFVFEHEYGTKIDIMYDAILLEADKNKEKTEKIRKLDQRMEKREIISYNHEKRISNLERTRKQI